MSRKTQLLVYLIVLALCDTIIPVPITALVLVYVILQRPSWFRAWVEDIYGPGS